MAFADLSDPRAVRAALDEFRRIGRESFLAKYGFGRARRYFLIDGGERFDSKALVGAAHGYQFSDAGPLTPADFSGGEATVAQKLRSLGFDVVPASDRDQPTFEVGRLYRRRWIHEEWGGQYQSGIVTPAGRPYLLLFTGGGEGYGYADGWTQEGVYRYFGEGQKGDMIFERGNSSLRDHAVNGKVVHLFEKEVKGEVRYIGMFACSSFEWVDAPDVTEAIRRAIVFHLVPSGTDDANEVPEDSAPADQGGLELSELRSRALQAAAAAPEASATVGKRTYYERSAIVRRYVLARANGVCECCEGSAPFTRRDGSPYLEPHHTQRVSDGGLDHPRLVAGICPTCHRRIHHGIDGAEVNARLQERLKTLEP